MVQLYHKSDQRLRYVYYFIIADCLDFVKILLGVPDLLSENVCIEVDFFRYLFLL